MLGPVFHVQRHGRHLLEVQPPVPARSDGLLAHHVARLCELVYQPGHLHHLQPRVPQGLQAHTNLCRLMNDHFVKNC